MSEIKPKMYGDHTEQQLRDAVAENMADVVVGPLLAELDATRARAAERDTARDTACRLSEIALAALAFIDALPTPQVMTAEQQEAWDRLQALR